MRWRAAAAVLVLSTMCAAQGMGSHPQANRDAGDAHPNRALFGELCGIADTTMQKAVGLSRSADGEWKVVTDEQRAGSRDRVAARVWRENSWMVDLHDAPGPTMHTAQMCFGATGRLMILIDDYMDIPSCSCLRSTALRFDANGKMIRREQRFNSVETGAEMEVPEAAKGFPEVYDFRTVEQLPFYALLKK